MRSSETVAPSADGLAVTSNSEKNEMPSPAVPPARISNSCGKSKLIRAGLRGSKTTSFMTRRAMGGIPGIPPGQMASGQTRFQAGAPSETSGTLTNFSSLGGIR